MMINAYDFDKTIYDGDSTLDFYFYCLRRNKNILFVLPYQVLFFIKYKLGLVNKVEFKEKFFSFLKKVDNIDLLINDFWDKNEFKIKKWYLNQKKDTDLIISASPEFLLLEIKKRLHVKYLICTKVNKHTGKFNSNNCYGEEKVLRLKKELKDLKINKFYSDSMSDLPMMNISKQPYLVKKDKILNI